MTRIILMLIKVIELNLTRELLTNNITWQNCKIVNQIDIRNWDYISQIIESLEVPNRCTNNCIKGKCDDDCTKS